MHFEDENTKAHSSISPKEIENQEVAFYNGLNGLEGEYPATALPNRGEPGQIRL